MKLPSFPQLLLIFLEIVIISVLVHLNRIGIICGLEYFFSLLGTVILFTSKQIHYYKVSGMRALYLNCFS